ncbi:hypothetical protein OKW40_003526 [Paraburkholderia sp. RAU6.4a]|uniref:hypothetical protein n=1 Tax=Paraburkholderia sp. RAU6.4a TaxID=2991067 RepID=UPI003D241CEC
MTVFIRAFDAPVDGKQAALHAAIDAVRQGRSASSHAVFDVEHDSFAVVPGSPFSYWVSSSLREVFLTMRPLEAGDRSVKQGLATADDFRFVRAVWEVPAAQLGRRWLSFAKGGAYSPFYADIYLCVNWESGGSEIITFTKPGSDRPASRPQNTGYFSRPGLTWPLRTQRGFGVRAMPAGCAFGHKGPAAFIEENDSEHLLALLAIMTSTAFKALVEVQMAFGSYEVGVVQRTPIAALGDKEVSSLSKLARRAWSLKRSQDTMSETSHAFILPSVLNERVAGIDRDRDRDRVERDLAAIQMQLDDAAFALYRITDKDRAAIEVSFERVHPLEGSVDADNENEVDEGDVSESANADADADALASWLFGVAFARFDPRVATGERATPVEPDPFDPLPARSPGMYPEGDEPTARPDVLVDDEGHADDFATRVHAIAERVRVDVPENLRAWFAKEFFPLHIKMYSKSRRKAPIYWQLATPSAGYSVWLYFHTFSRDTLFRVQNDYAAPKLAHEERRLESLISELRDGATAAERKVLAAQEAMVEELRAFLDEVKRVAPLWNPNLDDGVILNFAPLWRLVPQNKSWQKELKSTWDALCEAKYDWAHLAMHLWPERVVPKCSTNRSFAIAHGLEDVFWVESADGKWSARKTPTRTVDELVRERTSPAVKSALKTLLEAPTASGNAGRSRGGRSKGPVEGGNA